MANPGESDNFYAASVRLWIADNQQDIRGILAVFGGTDSDWRGAVAQKRWQEIAKSNGLALVGCYFRGDGEQYEKASQGSGAALLKMLDQISDAVHIPALREIPLVLVGYSSGAMFAYNFACWQPERTASFISVKTGPIFTGSDARVVEIPALFIVGECDAERLKFATDVFSWQRRFANGRWAIAVEANHGHEWTPAIDGFLQVYIKAVAASLPLAGSGQGFRVDRFRPGDGIRCDLAHPAATTAATNKSPQDAVWLPNLEAAAAWGRFTKGISIEALEKSAGQTEKPGAMLNPAFIDLGKIETTSTTAGEVAKTVDIQNIPPQKLHWAFRSADTHLTVTAIPVSDTSYRLTVSLNIDGMNIGMYKGEIQARGTADGVGEQNCSLEIRARVASSLQIMPESIYLGVVDRGQIIEKTITVTGTDTKEVHLRDVKSSRPDFASASLASPIQGLPAKILCRFNTAAALGNQSGYFDLFVDAPKNLCIRVPFIVFVSKKDHQPDNKNAEQTSGARD